MTTARKAPPARRGRRKEPAALTAQRHSGAAGRAPIDFEEPIPEGESSVEDPLQDWPEVEVEKDRWLLERNGERDEAPDS